MIKLVTYAYIRSECDISLSVPDDELDSKIRWSQDMLRMLLGKTFYDEIVSQFSGNSLTTDNRALHDPYIKQFLAWQTNEYWTVRANFKDTRAGFRVKVEEFSTAASDAQMAMLIKEAKGKASMFKNEMVSFILEEKGRDSSKYQLYTHQCDTAPSNGSQISAVFRRNRQQYDINRQIERGS